MSAGDLTETDWQHLEADPEWGDGHIHKATKMSVKVKYPKDVGDDFLSDNDEICNDRPLLEAPIAARA